MPSLLLLNGPNLNLLGTRQPDIYGHDTLQDIEDKTRARARPLGYDIASAQHNSEGALVDALQAARETQSGVIFNAGGYTHTSVTLRDAVASVGLPTVEVHMSNIHAREPFRHFSYLSDVTIGQIAGFGAMSYVIAVDALVAHLEAC